ncbi:histidine phosphatase family protein [Nocardioides marmoribigeumensis]|uniref:Phosphoglycerate mutase n=1 Tax=Nocardioides marmoribigeumensis TaxID=433649 RepID=A0ABU2BXN9_9ACTN|nr:histidine phosphatase family protein [Nocardioides marmoribigeumensis]MDR7363161.1 putative phosphoglycerate mutase [Nocardioides marmoribigeumensis]
MTHPVYLVRHGQSEWNVLRLTQGQTAHPRLTDLGRDQAQRAARTIEKDLTGPSPRILSSDLVRARETAEVLARRLGVLDGQVVLDERLREQHLGSLEGRGYDETWAVAAEHDWSDPTLPVAGGESLQDVHDRMASMLAGLDRNQVTVLVSHGDAIRAVLAHLGGLEPHQAPWVEVPNGAVARIDGRAISWIDP